MYGKTMRRVRKERIIFSLLWLSGAGLYFFTNVSYAFLMLTVLSVYAVSAFVFVKCGGRKLELSFSGKSQGEKEETLEMMLDIQNQSRFPAMNIRLFLLAENRLTGEKTRWERELCLLPMQKKQFSFLLQSAFCGCVQICSEEVEISDTFHLFVCKRSVEAEMECLILPAVRELSAEEETWSCYDMESDCYAFSKSGNDSSETFGIRAYQEGDHLKSVHWKLSEKMGEMMVREFGLPIENSLLILADKNEREEHTLSAEKKSRSAELVCSLSYTALCLGITHAVGWYDSLRRQWKQYEIKSETDFYEASAEMLATPYRKNAKTAAEHFLESEAEKKYGIYWYVTESETAEQDTELINDGNIKIYRTKDVS